MSNLVKKDIRMPPEMARMVEQASDELGISQSEFVRRVLDSMIARERLGLPIAPGTPREANRK